MKLLRALSSVAVVLLFTGIANANLVIVPTYESSITSDPNASTIENTIQAAINNLDNSIANNVTVSITFGEMSSGLGQSSTYQYDINYSNYVADLTSHQTLTVQDTTARASLPLSSTTNPVNGSTQIQTTGALLRAFGINANPPAGQTDSTVEFNTSLLNISLGNPGAGKYSLASVVTHEMDEVLGVGGGGSQLESGGSTTGAIGPLDLYRYSAPGVRSYTTTPGADPYFSINGGTTNLAYFNQTGNGDYADWGNGITNDQQGNTPPLVQDAFGTPGSNPQLSSEELTALDVVGWNLTPAGLLIENAPEPSTWAMLFGGIAVLVVFRYRAKARA